jgi:twinfilin-like protein
MSHSSGIPVSSQLSDTFGGALTSEKIRIIKAQIVNDEVVDIQTMEVSGTEAEDLDKVPGFLEPTVPAYILFRQDEKGPNRGYLWLLMCYVPDKAKVREKMTYASTRANLKRHLGSANFSAEIFGTIVSDFDAKGYKAFLAMQKADTPLTANERQSAAEREQGLFVGGASTAYVHGVAFPVEQAVVQALKGLLSGSHNYVQITIDADAEKITLAGTKTLSISDLSDQVPSDEPRFHFFRYDHEHDGQNLKSVVMVYSCPDGSGNTKSAPVRQRMLYSSSKANIENILTSIGGKTDVKIEVNQGSEVAADSIHNQLHPPKEEKKEAFAKPKGPTRGGKRLIRDPKSP